LEIALDPQFKVADNSANHGLLPIMVKRKIDLNSVLEHIRINPREYFFSVIEEDHIFIYDEVAVNWSQSKTRSYDGFSIL